VDEEFFAAEKMVTDAAEKKNIGNFGVDRKSGSF
jgi:hypothetical protein